MAGQTKVDPGRCSALDAAERHRLLIDAWFHPCSQEMHAQLGHMYVADPRFAATHESYAVVALAGR